MKLYFLEFILTTKCNQQCSYCNVYNINKEKTKLEVDLDFLKYVLQYIPKNTKIEFCGGEPGILTNLNEAFNIVNNHNNVKAIQIMSNGLVRKNEYDWLENENVFYCEHLINEIDGTDINKFYEELNFVKKPRWKYVIVTSYKTINSLLANYEYFKNLGMFNDMFWYKLMNPKTERIDYFIQDLIEFYRRLSIERKNHNYEINMYMDRLHSITTNKNNIHQKQICGMNSPLPTINFETKEIVHCGAYLKSSKRFKFNPNNIEEHLKCNLFNTFEDYCKNCYIYTNTTPHSILSCKKGIPYNQELEYL